MSFSLSYSSWLIRSCFVCLVELYFFSTDKAWVNYEAIQSDIIDHILSVMGAFGLRVFQDLSGADLTQRSTFESAESR